MTNPALEYPLNRLPDNRLQFGSSSFPTERITRFWVFSSSNKACLEFVSIKGERALLTLQLETAQKTDRLIQLLSEQKVLLTKIPEPKSVRCDADSLTVTCRNREEATQHAQFTTSTFVDSDPKIKFYGVSYKIDLPTSYVKRFSAHPRLGFFCYQADRQGNETKIKSTEFTFADWLLLTDANLRTETKENWEQFLKALKSEKNQKYEEIILKLEELLQIDPFFPSRIRLEIGHFVKPLIQEREARFIELLGTTFQPKSARTRSPCRDLTPPPQSPRQSVPVN